MTLVPFILDLAEELNEIHHRGFISGAVDVDDFGFGMYPHEFQQASPRRTRSVSQLFLLPNTRGRHHPYCRNGNKVTVLDKDTAATSDRDQASRPSTSANAAAAAAAANNNANSVFNKHGFQVSMNVKQFAPNELTVKTVENCVFVEGLHDEKEDGHGVISRHFVRKYMLPKGFDPNEVSSTLSSDGILTVKAPSPATRAEEKVERIVYIQHTGPAQLLIKDGAGSSGGSNKEKQQVAATTSNHEPKEQQAEREKEIIVNGRNSDANADANTYEINDEQETVAEPASVTTSIEPILLEVNIPSLSAIVAVAATGTAMEKNENASETDTDTVNTIADVPVADGAIPAGAIESIVLAPADGVAAGTVGDSTDDDIAIPIQTTAGDLMAAADAAILMTKMQCENGTKTAGEELDN